MASTPLFASRRGTLTSALSLVGGAHCGGALVPPVTTCIEHAPVVRPAAGGDVIPSVMDPQVIEREGRKVLFIMGPLRGELEGDRVRWGEGRITLDLLIARRDARGWVFHAHPDVFAARADTFLGPLSVDEGVARPSGVPPRGAALDGVEFQRVYWDSFLRYRRWLTSASWTRQADGATVGLSIVARGPWLWRVDAQERCVTRVPARLPRRAAPLCFRGEYAGLLTWGDRVIVYGVTGHEPRPYATTDDFSWEDLGPVPDRTTHADYLCDDPVSWSWHRSSDGIHSLYGRCHGRPGWCSYDRRDGEWRDTDFLPAHVYDAALRDAQAAYYDPRDGHVRVVDLDRGTARDLGASPAAAGPCGMRIEPSVSWLRDGTLVLRGAAAMEASPGARSTGTPCGEGLGYEYLAHVWIARGGAPPFRLVRRPRGSALVLADADHAFAQTGASLLRTYDAGEHWTPLARHALWVQRWGLLDEPREFSGRCFDTFCVLNDRLLVATTAPDTPGEALLSLPERPPLTPPQ